MFRECGGMDDVKNLHENVRTSVNMPRWMRQKSRDLAIQRELKFQEWICYLIQREIYRRDPGFGIEAARSRVEVKAAI